MSHDLPIPDAQNSVARAALAAGSICLFFLEEDIVLPTNAIAAMVEMNVDVAAILYNLKGGGPGRLGEIRTDDGELHTLTTGCMLIKRRVFETLPDPWFRTDLSPGLRHPGSSTPKPFLDLIPTTFDYGGHDGFLTLSAIRAGFQCVAVPELRCEHLKLDGLGKAGVNDGCHRISRVE
jgi:hypothetical protein